MELTMTTGEPRSEKREIDEEVVRLLSRTKMTLSEIAAELGVVASYVGRVNREFNVRPPYAHYSHKKPELSGLKEKNIAAILADSKDSVSEIARKLGIKRQYVSFVNRKYNVRPRR